MPIEGGSRLRWGGTPNFLSGVKAKKEFYNSTRGIPFLGFLIPFFGFEPGVKIGGTPLP